MIIDTVRKTISDYGLIKNGDSVLIGLSGGADSVCLAHVLCSLADTLGITLYTAHLNHGIRGAEAERDEQFAKSFSEKLGIKCFTMKADIPALAKKNGISEEAAGRQIRYDFFKNLCAEYGIDKIATAHNKNDNAETLLMNFMRGSGLRGLCGIPYKRGNIIRPVLNIERSQIEAYCEENNLDYVTDSTNSIQCYTRNKIRHTLLPLVTNEFNLNFVNTVSDNAVLLGEDSAYIEKQARRAYESLVSDNHVKTDDILSLDNAIERRVIRLMIKDVRQSLDNISAVYVNDILTLLKKNSGSSLNLPNGIVAKIEYGKLIIEQKKQANNSFSYTFSCNSTGIIPEISKEITISHADRRIKDGCIYLSCGENDLVTVRSRREGDIFHPYGMTGTKKVKEYFINNKIPREARSQVPIIEINGQIAAVGERVDRGFLFKDRGIKIEFKPLEVKD